MRPSGLGVGFIGLTRCSARLRPILWRWWYNQLVTQDKAGELLFMNYGYAYGYAEKLESPALVLEPADEPFRYPLQLYAHVVDGLDLQGQDVLEVGSGRGGGGSFLLRYRAPRSYTGVDFSESAIARCREQLVFPNAHWLEGSADALPVEASTMDVVVNVESSHCYPSFSGFLAEVRRVLRPGGFLAFCDLRPRAAVIGLDRAFDASGLTLLARREITPRVLQALDCVSSQRQQQIARRVPRWLRPAFRDFAAMPDTIIYNMLQYGQLSYLSCLLQKSK